MVERIQSPSHKKLVGDRSLEGDLRDKGHEFGQGELVTKKDAQRILKQADKPCTIQCKVNGMKFQVPLTKQNEIQVYINLARIINESEVRGLEVKE